MDNESIACIHNKILLAVRKKMKFAVECIKLVKEEKRMNEVADSER